MGINTIGTAGPLAPGAQSIMLRVDFHPRTHLIEKVVPIMLPTKLSHRRFSLSFLGLACVLGCSSSDSSEQRPWEIDASTLVPVEGVVTLNGKPLTGAVVAFMSSSGIPGIAETGKDGEYTVKTTELPGAIPGEYKVSISYLLSPEGDPQGLGARSALIHSPAMRAAVEQLPAEYSDMKLSKLKAHIGSKGGNCRFDLVAPIDSVKGEADQAETAKEQADQAETAKEQAAKAEPAKEQADKAEPAKAQVQDQKE